MCLFSASECWLSFCLSKSSTTNFLFTWSLMKKEKNPQKALWIEGKTQLMTELSYMLKQVFNFYCVPDNQK